MQKFMSHIRSAASLIGVLTVLLGVVYPVVVTVISQAVFNQNSNGSLIKKDDRIVGSQLLGQNFSEAKYFWGRPSASDYDALRSGGSNLSPANPKLLENVNARVTALKNADPENKAKIPVDLVTASGSGLDPHISLLAAEYQISRIAKARQIPEDEVQALITEHINMQGNIIGSPYVNVLELNLALDNMEK